jgi:Carboxypeptidase regulatory-like domain
MAATTVAMRCPACGADLRIVVAPQPPTQWFPCPQCKTPVPVLVPRDLPPLYSWEVYPGLYPPLNRPRVPRWRARRAVAAALLAVAVLAAALAAVLVYDGYDASRPASFMVDGTVEHAVAGVVQPFPGATVALTNDAGHRTSLLTASDGSFSFSNVPPGGVTVNVTAPGYSPQTLTTFVSVVYVTQTTGLVIFLSPGGAANASTVSLAPFPDLEQFLASIGSGAVLLGIIALVAGFAAVATFRQDRPAVGVVGGAAGLLAPLVMFYLSMSMVFPLLEDLSAVLAAAGSFTLALRAIQMAQTGPAPDSD